MKFYNIKYPNIDDIVTCLVKKIEKDVIYVELLEFDNIQGIIQYSNASTRRKKKIVCTVKENRIYPLLVLSVDRENGYIDLSNKYLSDEDKDNFMEKYNKEAKAVRIFNNFVKNLNNDDKNKEELAENSIWRIERYKCYEYLENEYLNKGNLNLFNFDEVNKNAFKDALNNYFGNYNVCSKFNFEIINTNFGGMSTIYNLFKMIEEKYEIKGKVLAVPNYLIEINSESKTKNEIKLNEILKYIEDYSKDKKLILKNTLIQSNFT